MFVGHNADPLLQLAMRGPSGPMGLTGRPGPLVRIYIHLHHLVSMLWLEIVSHVLFRSSGSSWCTRTEGRERRGGSSGETFINTSQNGQNLWTSIVFCSAAAENNAYHFSMIARKGKFKVTPLSLIPNPICFRDHAVLWDPLAPLESLAEE